MDNRMAQLINYPVAFQSALLWNYRGVNILVAVAADVCGVG